MIKTNKNIQECDVLVIGGGIGGLMAAIAAADAGARVIVAEKSDTRRSGSGTTGNDHFNCYIPGVNADSLEECLKEFRQSLVGKGSYDVSIQKLFLERTFEVVQDWHSWGINMKPHGEWEFNGHAFPGRKRVFLKYDGRNQKPVLTAEAKKRGVVIENKTPIRDYLTDANGQIIGAVGVSIKNTEPELKIFKTKCIISCTGNASRLYPSITPSQMFNTAHCPCCCGNGRAAAYRAGASLINLELPNTHAGPRYFERCGKATWIGVLSDPEGKPVGPFVTKPNKELGDVTADVWHGVFNDRFKDGTGPVYMNCTETSPEDMEYMIWGLNCEGDTSLLDAMDKQGIDLSRHMVEFGQYNPMLIGRGIEIDEKGATKVPGLYSAGDETGNFRSDIAGAAVMGRIAGEAAAAEAAARPAIDDQLETHEVVKELQELCSQLMEREAGDSWKDFNYAIQQLMNDYAGISIPRSENLLRTGLKYLIDLENAALGAVGCKDSHELMRALDAFDLALMGRLIFLTAMERKESRGLHRRSDFTFTNPLMDDMMLMIYQLNGEPVTDWRKSW
ncbi:MAG: FAD-dependent oxidoreductase [Firmicutes bacterium HGW-Firmicutes-11]|jgi:succinate dehydrogenase/fumarate reductase flavoprotein subunit|nr:MAG: FAD-dependent oxidoreductase [Firmicutes bacterium HGW-Firmicutes-11]